LLSVSALALFQTLHATFYSPLIADDYSLVMGDKPEPG